MREKGKRVYIITWDLTASDKAARRMFYYYLVKIRGKYSDMNGELPANIFITEDKKIARQVYDLASRYASKKAVFKGVVIECD